MISPQWALTIIWISTLAVYPYKNCSHFIDGWLIINLVWIWLFFTTYFTICSFKHFGVARVKLASCILLKLGASSQLEDHMLGSKSKWYKTTIRWGPERIPCLALWYRKMAFPYSYSTEEKFVFWESDTIRLIWWIWWMRRTSFMEQNPPTLLHKNHILGRLAFTRVSNQHLGVIYNVGRNRGRWRKNV